MFGRNLPSPPSMFARIPADQTRSILAGGPVSTSEASLSNVRYSVRFEKLNDSNDLDEKGAVLKRNFNGVFLSGHFP